MWVEPDELMDADDALVFTRLAGAFAPDRDAAEPSAAELDELRLMVAARFDRSVAVPAPVAVSPTRTSRGRARRVGALAVLLLAGSASAAAAAGEGLPLPGPVRAAAYAIGLPVDSPALDATHRHIQALEQALEAGDAEYAREAILRMERSLIDVPDDEREQAETEVGTALASARSLLDDVPLSTGDHTDPPPAPEVAPSPALPPSGEADADPAPAAAQHPPSPTAPTAGPVEPEAEARAAPGPDPGSVGAPGHAPEPAVMPTEDAPSQDEVSDPASAEEPTAGEDDLTIPTSDDTLADAGTAPVAEPALATSPLDDAGDTDLAEP